MENKDYYQSYEYWFENPEEHSVVDNYDEDYYAYRIYQHFLPQLFLPKEGQIVVLGTHKCVSFNLLCQMYGEERCVGYDLYNPSQHPKVIIKDCIELGEQDNISMAFCHNDIGNFPKTPELKLHCQKWAAKNMVVGGIFLGRNNRNSRKIDVEGLMKDLGFENIQFEDLPKFSAYDFTKVMSYLSEDEIACHMFSIRRQIV